jgi:Putative metal-binding motif
MRNRLAPIVLLSIWFAVACGPTNNTSDDDDTIDAPNGGSDSTGGDDASIVDGADPTDADTTDASTDAMLGLDGPICPDHACNNPVSDNCAATEICNNGSDDNCNGTIDEGCLCAAGAVQSCFRGPPGRRHVGSCVDGQQTCVGTGEFREWGPCVGGIAPDSNEACDSQDNNCNGCVDDSALCCVVELACPGPGDMPDGQPFVDYVIDGTAFYSGTVMSWAWDVTGGPCDRLFLTTTTPVKQSFTIAGQTTSHLTFHPTLSGDYTIHVHIVTTNGTVYDCTFIVHIAGPGLRIETCSDRTADTDLDLHVHKPGTTTPWFTTTLTNTTINTDDCYYTNCKAGSFTPANWGYANSPLAECVGGPEGTQWQTLGYCRNPRLDIDSIRANGIPENVNIDSPVNGSTYRVMLAYYSGTGAAHPMVNVYCGGILTATYGAAPDVLTNFTTSGGFGGGNMWRVVDATPAVAGGVTTGCTLTPLHPPGMTTGYYVTNNNRAY